jgi:uncharacterized protein (TIRG00374 family)
MLRLGRRIPGWFWQAVVYALSLGCLFWVYHDFNWREELPYVLRMHWGWIALAVGCDILVYLMQAVRWRELLKPAVKVPLYQSLQAVYIGLFANEVLPLRSGELIRCYLLGWWSGAGLPLMLGAALIERLIDGFLLVMGFLAVTLTVDTPRALDLAALVLASLVALLGGIVVFAVLSERFAHHVTTRHRWSAPLRIIVEGFHSMGRSRTFLHAAGLSVVYLALQVVPIDAMMRGYDVDPGWHGAAIVLVVLRLSTVVPGLPGNLGLFNAAAYMAMHRLLGIDAQTAKSLSAVMFFVITVPLLIGGAIALATTEVELREIHRRARQRPQS